MFSFVSLALAAAVDHTPVRATLADGQVLMGEVRTRTLHLETGSGIVDVPLRDIGEVVPASADGLGESGGVVDVWLRNGSELRGRWSEPELTLAVRVGGAEVPVELPMNELNRFQLQGGAAWPGGPVYRLRTAWGDDLLIDAERTHLNLTNRLGSFAPALSECVHAAPVGAPDGDWRLTLKTGTVLIGRLVDDAVTVALPMGPKEMTVPLESFVSLNLESWAWPQAVAAGRTAVDSDAPTPASAPPPRRPTANDGWFDRAELDAAKEPLR